MPSFPTLYLPAELSAPPVSQTGGRLWGGVVGGTKATGWILPEDLL